MNIAYFRRGFGYDAWANRRVLEAMRKTPAASDRARQVMAHLAGSGRVWLARLHAEATEGLTPWPAADLDETARILRENEKGFAALLDGLSDEALAEVLAYRTTTGTAMRTSRLDIFTHLLLHGAYHRGQLAVEIKHAGGEPVVTDFIFFAREDERFVNIENQ